MFGGGGVITTLQLRDPVLNTLSAFSKLDQFFLFHIASVHLGIST